MSQDVTDEKEGDDGGEIACTHVEGLDDESLLKDEDEDEIVGLSASLKEWALSDWQMLPKDSVRPHLRLQGTETTENLLQVLSSESYAGLITEMSTLNPGVVKLLKKLGTSGSHFRQVGYSLEDGRDLEFEAITCMLARLHSVKMKTFFTGVMSLLAVKCSLGKVMWEMLNKMRLVYSFNYSQRLAVDLGKIMQEPRRLSMQTIAIATADNKSYYLRTNEEHADPNRKNEFLHTANWLKILIPRQLGLEECTAGESQRLCGILGL